MTNTQPDATQLRDLIDHGLKPPPAVNVGRLRRWLRRALLMISRPHARHQLRIDRQLLAELERLRADQREAAQYVARFQEEVAGGHAEVTEWLGNLQRDKDALQSRLSRLAGLVATDSPLDGDGLLLETFDHEPGGSVIGFRQNPKGDARQGVYRGFEDYFRGSEATIRERQRAYLPLLNGCTTALDVGCGRGELLELMAEIGVEATGIDIDPAMVAHCRQKGLTGVETADAVSHLQGVDDESLGAILALQVIEHLPYSELVAFLRSSHRKLRPGGRLIMETVNPHAPQALKQFWIDPTHQHPLFPEIVVALCALTGFASAYIWYPQGSGDPDRDRSEQPDYAVVAETHARAGPRKTMPGPAATRAPTEAGP